MPKFHSGRVYEATRYAWKISKSKAEQAEIILATRQGIIVGVFVAEKWLEATSENFPAEKARPNVSASSGMKPVLLSRSCISENKFQTNTENAVRLTQLNILGSEQSKPSQDGWAMDGIKNYPTSSLCILCVLRVFAVQISSASGG